MVTAPKPPPWAVARDHPLARGLAHFYPLWEGVGPPHDVIRGAPAAPSGAPTWIRDAYGAARHYVAASLQYDDLGAWPEVNGASRVTLTVLGRRTASGSIVTGFKGTTTSSELGFYISSDDNIYCMVGNGSDAWRRFTLAGTGWHVYSWVFDGTQATNATRLRAWADGVEQTLNDFGTIPATIPATADHFLIGRDQTRGNYSDGDIAAVALHTIALAPSAVVALHRDLFAVVRPSEVRRSFVSLAEPALLRTVVAVIPQTIAFTDEHPTGSPVEREDEIVVLATPTTGDLVSTLTATVDGAAATVSVTSVAPNSKRGTIATRFQFGHTYTVEWTATTVAGYPNVHTQTFTVREAETSIPELAVVRVPVGAVAPPERVFLIVPLYTLSFAERVDLRTISTGAVGSDLVEIRVIEGLPLSYRTAEKVALDVARLVDLGAVFTLSLAVGDAFETCFAVAETIEGEPHTEFAATLDDIAGGRTTEFAATLETGLYRDTEMALSEEVGPGGQTEMAATGEVDTPALEPLEGQIESRSEGRAAEETE